MLNRVTGLLNRQEQKFWPNSFEAAANLASPRVLKTHMSYEMLPNDIITKKKAKVIYVIRNPRDTCMSFYHHWKVLEGYTGDLLHHLSFDQMKRNDSVNKNEYVEVGGFSGLI